ncbi:TPA: DUF551 domain-containing protein [Salmonella enterica subsp. enterica serovar Newport]
MTTITRERLEQIYVECEERDPAIFEIRELVRIALASLEAEPVAWRYRTTDINGNPRQGWSFSEEASLMGLYQPLYAVPPVQETGVYKDMLNIIGLLENNEWAEHCTSTVLGSLLESEITRLVGKEQPAPVVLDDGREQFETWMLKKWGRERQEYDFAMGKFLHGENYADSYTRHMWKAWSTSRSTMLQAGNSPVTPDGWISCSERMPDREYVLAGDFSGTHYLASIPNVQVGIYADWFDDEKPCWDDGDGNDLHLKQVTHWMPLAAAPEKETGPCTK